MSDKVLNEEIFIRLYVHARQSGLIGELGSELFTTLATISTYMNSDGECYPTIESLSKDLKVGYSTVRRYIEKLRNFRFSGEPVIIVQTKQEGLSRRNYYKVLPNSGWAIFDGKTVVTVGNPDSSKMSLPPLKNEPMDSSTMSHSTAQKRAINNNHINNNQNNNNDTKVKGKKGKKSETEDKAMTVKEKVKKEFNPNEPFKSGSDAVKYFCHKYKAVYGVEYAVNFGLDAGKIKNTLFKNYSPEVVKELIDILFREYDKRFKRDGYLRPSISSLISTWLTNQLIAIKDEDRRNGSGVNIDKSLYDDGINSDEDLIKALKKINGGKEVDLSDI